MKKFALGVAALLALLASGCATVVDGKTQSITFLSEPAGAEVLINGLVMGKTPLTIQVQRAESANLTFKLEGYNDYSVKMTSKLNGMFWGNIIIGGLLGSTTDASTGASREYTPGVFTVKLEPVKQ